MLIPLIFKLGSRIYVQYIHKMSVKMFCGEKNPMALVETNFFIRYYESNYKYILEDKELSYQVLLLLEKHRTTCTNVMCFCSQAQMQFFSEVNEVFILRHLYVKKYFLRLSLS